MHQCITMAEEALLKSLELVSLASTEEHKEQDVWESLHTNVCGSQLMRSQSRKRFRQQNVFFFKKCESLVKNLKQTTKHVLVSNKLLFNALNYTSEGKYMCALKCVCVYLCM